MHLALKAVCSSASYLNKRAEPSLCAAEHIGTSLVNSPVGLTKQGYEAQISRELHISILSISGRIVFRLCWPAVVGAAVLPSVIITAAIPQIGHFSESQPYLVEVHAAGWSWHCRFSYHSFASCWHVLIIGLLLDSYRDRKIHWNLRWAWLPHAEINKIYWERGMEAGEYMQLYLQNGVPEVMVEASASICRKAMTGKEGSFKFQEY